MSSDITQLIIRGVVLSLALTQGSHGSPCASSAKCWAKTAASSKTG